MIKTAFLAILIVGMSAAAAFPADMSTWEAATAKRCPGHHLTWICDGCWDDYLTDYESGLSKVTRQRISQIVSRSHLCDNVGAGLSCEMSEHVDALHRLGLLERFVEWGCVHYRCEEVAICSRTDHRSAAR